MPVSVVQVGHVRVRVGRWCVRVGMDVARPNRHAGVHVVVMTVVVPVAVRMMHRFMGVLVLVTCCENE